MVKDISEHGEQISDESFYSYIRALEKLYIIDNIPAWNPKLRSKSSIRTTDKRELIDPSLAAVALGAKPNDLIKDMETFGFLFESLCSRDLSIYIESLGGHLFHYKDSDDLEIDFILHLPDGKWGAIEVKTGLNEIEKATKNLLKLQNKVDELKAPSFLMILTGTDLAYQTEEGIYVIPLGCLKP
jgi:predicted AAA+ superfamily ATPase